MFTSFGSGFVHAGEQHVAATPRMYKPDGTRPGILYLHGYSTDATLFFYDGIAQAIVDAGFPMLACDLGGPATFGNATVEARIAEAKTWMQANMGAKSGPVLLLAHSMGTLSGLNYLRTHPSDVAALAAIVPAVDLRDLHDNNRNGTATPIEAAYTNLAGYEAALTTRNPADTPSAYTGAPVRFWVSEDDPVALPALARTFATAAGGITVVSNGSHGHSQGGTDPQSIIDYFTGIVA